MLVLVCLALQIIWAVRSAHDGGAGDVGETGSAAAAVRVVSDAVVSTTAVSSAVAVIVVDVVVVFFPGVALIIRDVR